LVIARKISKPVDPSSLGEVGRRISILPPNWAIWKGSIEIGARRSKIRAELPVVVEAWAKVADDSRARLFVNRTPVVGELSAWTNASNLHLSGCGCEMMVIESSRAPVKLWINIETPYMPITTSGKEPDISRFVPAIKEAATKAIGKAKRASSRASSGERKTKKDAILENLEAGIAMASGGGAFRFSQRQLFYAIRPEFMKIMGEEPDWDYFCKVITDFENQLDRDIPKMYRDPRGIIYHPHIGEEIPLGTLYVEQYRRPPWLFRKVLYIEKEGLFSILRAEKWPERNDCALMTSKGFSSRAARDLIDYLAETDEECDFYCIHDADASGTMIYQTLHEATRARGKRKVHVENLGLDPAEGRAMGLQVETFKANKDQRLAVASYIPDSDKIWLQSNRIELNAMTTPQFLEWLDRVFEPHRGKVVPPADVLDAHLKAAVRNGLSQAITRSILRRAGIDARVDRTLDRRSEAIRAASEVLPQTIGDSFARDTSQPWVTPVDRVARKIIGSRPART
jgi:hypothetical protein